MNINNIKNFFLNDIILDWLHLHGDKYGYKSNTNIEIDTFLHSFNNDLTNEVISFLCSHLLYKNLSVDEIIYQIPNNLSIHNKINQTIEYIKLKKPIIYNPFLGDYNDIYGSTSFIVRSDYLSIFFEIFNDQSQLNEPLSINNDYYVINIKNIKIHNDTYCISKTNKNDFHRASTHLFNHLLNHLLSVNNNLVFFITKKTNNLYLLHDFSNKLLTNKTQDAIISYRNILKNGNKLDPINNNNQIILPNLSNYDDYPWTSVKLSIAEKTKDITLLWNCSSIQRNKAFQHNIFTYHHPKLNANILGKTSKQAFILDKIIDINRQNNITYSPRTIKNYLNTQIIKNQQIQFIVDFETTNINNSSVLFLIGCICIHNNKHHSFNSFISNDFNVEDNESTIIYQWLDYMNSITNNIVIHHWGNAEPSIFNSIIEKYHIDKDLISNIQWNDMLSMFKREPFVIKNVFSFGLKEICKQLYSLGLISHIWDDNDIDGKTTLVYIANEIKINNSSNSFKSSQLVQSIIYYNKIDCLVLLDILQFFKSITN